MIDRKAVIENVFQYLKNREELILCGCSHCKNVINETGTELILSLEAMLEEYRQHYLDFKQQTIKIIVSIHGDRNK